MKNKPGIIVVGFGSTIGLETAMQKAKIAFEQFGIAIADFKILEDIEDYKELPVDELQFKINHEFTGEFTGDIPRQKHHIDSPKSKYINKPIRNFRR